MTWIVATPTMFGYGFAVSDIRVTLRDRSELDCLQKIHCVGRHVALGFAGSVKIGFDMVDELQKAIFCEDESLACVPQQLADWWPGRAREVFGRSEQTERDRHSHLVMLSVHPQEHGGNPAWPRSYVHVFRSPNFEPECIPTNRITTIGCGTSYDHCRNVIEDLQRNERRMSLLVPGERASGGMGVMLGIQITNLLKKTVSPRISSHLHYCWVYRGRIIIKTNNHVVYGNDEGAMFEAGSGIDRPGDSDPLLPTAAGDTPFQMPRIATTWQELNRLLSESNIAAGGSVA